MTAYANKSFTVALGLSKEGRDNWDRIFKKKGVVEEYSDLVDQLREARTGQGRDWEAREDLIVETMNELYHKATVDEQKHIEELDHNRAFPDWKGKDP